MRVPRFKACIPLVFFLVSFRFMSSKADDAAFKLTADNIDMTLASNELVFINFYAEWCRFSNLLAPIFEEASKK
uniref:Thioredoxin domain-containing protein n=1 Tax=Megaselia scalaris TaxID=36166 RepID=T1GI98_MEGSC